MGVPFCTITTFDRPRVQKRTAAVPNCISAPGGRLLMHKCTIAGGHHAGEHPTAPPEPTPSMPQ
jgi:hypothetical protein